MPHPIARTPMIQSLAPAVDPRAATARIAAHRASSAGNALGDLSGPEATLANGARVYQSFTSGAVFTSAAFGTFSVSFAIDQKWKQTAALTTANDESVQDYLGAVVAPPVILAEGGQAVYFERGIIVARPRGGVFVVYGSIYARYRACGDVSSFLGLPISDEEAVGNGRRSRFDFGEICWRSDLGAHETHGAICDRYEALGGPGVFGFPTSDESRVMRDGKEIGRFNTFEGGKSIYWSPDTGAWDVYGAIKATWEQHGGAAGSLGFPICGETDTPLAHAALPYGIPNNDANGRFNDFQNGIIVWHPAGPYAGTYPLWNLPFHVDSFGSNFDDIHVQAKVQSSYGQSYSTWIPSVDDYASDLLVQADVFTVPAVHSDLTISVWFDGLGEHSLGEDERLGRYQGTLNISNLWGTLDPLDHAANQYQNSDFWFTSRFTTQPALPIAPNSSFRATFFWPYHNFKTPGLTWPQFARTFTDVGDDESTEWHPFDHLFYELAYEGLAAHGNCFGMCLESIYAQFRRSPFSEPIYDNLYNRYREELQKGGTPDPASVPDDLRLTDPINIKHGYQVGTDMINYFLGTFLSGRTHDPIKAFLESRASFQAGDLPMLSMSSDSFFDGAHVVRPYEWNSDASPWTIKVANPNAPYPKNADDNAPLSLISIDPKANTFSFQEGWTDDKPPKPKIYTGGEWSGGRLFSVPYSVVSSQPQTPFWEVMALLATGTLLILGGDGSTEQITDESGRMYLVDSSATRGGTPTAVPHAHVVESNQSDVTTLRGQLVGADIAAVDHMKVINEDPQTRIPDFGPIPIFAATPRATIEASLIASKGRGYARMEDEIAQSPTSEVFYLRRPPAIPKRANATPASTPVQTAHKSPTAQPLADVVAQEVEHAVPIVERPTSSIEHAIACPQGGSYRWGLRSPIMSIVVQASTTTADTDVMRVDWPGRPGQMVTLRAGSTSKTATVQVVGPMAAGPKAAKIYQIDNLPITADQPVTVRLDNGGADLLIDNPGPQATIGLHIQAGPLAQNAAVRPSVTLEAGRTHRFSLTDWSAEKVATGPVSLQVLELGGTVIVTQVEI